MSADESHSGERETGPARFMKRRFCELPDVLTPADLMQFLPIGRNAVYEELRAKTIPSVRVGQKYLIAKAALRERLGGVVE